MFILELKFQQIAGSVDEKLQTCDFKKKQYRKLLAPLNFEVEYFYILNDWFRKPEYKDVLDYVISVGCQYYFHYLPLQKLGLPVPEADDGTTAKIGRAKSPAGSSNASERLSCTKPLTR